MQTNRSVCSLASVMAIVAWGAGISVVPARGEVPADPDFTKQWALQNTGQTVDGQAGLAGADIDALGAWSVFEGVAPVTVAIVAGGVDPHPEFASRLLEGRAVLGDLFYTFDVDVDGIGTHIAGIVAAGRDNGLGIAGLHPQARILPVRVRESVGLPTVAHLAAGITWAVDQGAKIIVVPQHHGSGSTALANAVQHAANHDVLIIATAGNSGNHAVGFPAAYATTLAVSATNNLDALASFSNYGAAVDLSAPGASIWSTAAGGDGYKFESHVAGAAAHVAGVAAMIRSHNPDLSADDVKAILMDSADDLGPAGHDIQFGAGRLNAHRALEDTPHPPLRIELLSPSPLAAIPDQPTAVLVRISPGSETLDGDPMLAYTISQAPYDFVSLTPLGGDLFSATLPAVPCRTQISFYISASGSGGGEVRNPPGGMLAPYVVTASVEDVIYFDDFESDSGWISTYEGGSATRGQWVRAIPIGTTAQPGYDRTPGHGQYCWITGQNPGGNAGMDDVDHGPVILTSPVIPLHGAPAARIQVSIWFHSSGSSGHQEDRLLVEFSRDGGDNWILADSIIPTNGWVDRTWLIGEIPGLMGNDLRIRFTTEDEPNDSLTEAAIDDVRVTAIHCARRPGDANGDGLIDLADFQRLHECLSGPGSEMPEPTCGVLDLDGDSRIDLSDVALFQNLFGG